MHGCNDRKQSWWIASRRFRCACTDTLFAPVPSCLPACLPACPPSAGSASRCTATMHRPTSLSQTTAPTRLLCTGERAGRGGKGWKGPGTIICLLTSVMKAGGCGCERQTGLVLAWPGLACYHHWQAPDCQQYLLYCCPPACLLPPALPTVFLSLFLDFLPPFFLAAVGLTVKTCSGLWGSSQWTRAQSEQLRHMHMQPMPLVYPANHRQLACLLACILSSSGGEAHGQELKVSSSTHLHQQPANCLLASFPPA